MIAHAYDERSVMMTSDIDDRNNCKYRNNGMKNVSNLLNPLCIEMIVYVRILRRILCIISVVPK
jgi:hypothetical protein